jgi:hypothetical protein
VPLIGLIKENSSCQGLQSPGGVKVDGGGGGGDGPTRSLYTIVQQLFEKRGKDYLD